MVGEQGEGAGDLVDALRRDPFPLARESANAIEELLDVLVCADAALRDGGVGYGLRKEIDTLLAKYGGEQ
jgi:hypothetical protein